MRFRQNAVKYRECDFLFSEADDRAGMLRNVLFA